MKPRLFDSETMVSRAATDGPGSSTWVVGLSAVTVVSSGTGGRISCSRLLGRHALERLGGRAIERLGGNSRTYRAQPAAIRVCRQFASGRGDTRAAMPLRRVR